MSSVELLANSGGGSTSLVVFYSGLALLLRSLGSRWRRSVSMEEENRVTERDMSFLG